MKHAGLSCQAGISTGFDLANTSLAILPVLENL